MDGVDGDRPWRTPEQVATEPGPAEVPADEHQRRVCERIDRARATIRHAEHRINRSAQVLDRSEMLLLSCADHIVAITEALGGKHPMTDGAHPDSHRVAGGQGSTQN